MKNNTETVTITKIEYDELKADSAKNKSLESDVAELTSKVNWLMEQFRLAQHRRFGASSEKSIQSDCDQLNIFNEAETTADILVPEPELVKIEKHFRKRKNMVNDKLSEDLPIEVIEHDIPAEEQICPECDGTLHVVSGGDKMYKSGG